MTMPPCIQLRSDFIYPDAGQLGQLVYHIKGMAESEWLPRVSQVSPGLYLSYMSRPAAAYPLIDFKVDNAPVSFCLMLSGQCSSRFLSSGPSRNNGFNIKSGTNTITCLKKTRGRMHIDPSLPFAYVELIIDPCLLGRYLPDRSMAQDPGKNLIHLSRQQGFFSLSLDPELRKTALEILNPPQLTESALDLFYQSRAMMLLSRQVELLCQDPGEVGGFVLNRGTRDQLEHAKSILTDSFLDPPTIPVLARQCGLNEFTLKKEFKKTFNTTIFSFVQKMKMEQAWTLIMEGNHSVSEAANTVGYINVSHFSKAFKKQFSINPGSLKKNRQQTCRAVLSHPVKPAGQQGSCRLVFS